MSISKKNLSGYMDLTAFEALTAATKTDQAKQKEYKPLIYIASPFAGDTEQNTKNARRYCRFAINNGTIPFAPHLLFPQFMDDKNHKERRLGIRFTLIFLSKCDELWAFGDKISDGMNLEIEKAEKRGMPVKYFNEKCEEVR